MKTKHEAFMKMIPDFIDNLLPADEIQALEAHLKTCEICAQELARQQAIKAGLRQTGRARLSDAARLRLYQVFNDERRQRGESLLQIPADLLARAKAKGVAVNQAGRRVVREGKKAKRDLTESGAHLAQVSGRGGKRVGRKIKQGAQNAAKNAANVGKEVGATARDTGRILTIDCFEIIGEARHSKGKALIAPARIMHNRVQAGVRMMTGGAKVTAKSMKGGAVMAKDAASLTATGVIEGVRTKRAISKTKRQVNKTSEKMKKSVKKAAKQVAEA